MKIRLAGLIIIGILITWCHAIFAEDAADMSVEEAQGWIFRKNSRITLIYPDDINLKKLETRLRSRYFSVSAIEKDMFANPAYEIEDRIMARLESIFLRTKEILAMDPPSVSMKIKVFRNRYELSDEYYRIFKTIQHHRSFYVHGFETIYTSMQDVSDSEISHEMSHAVIDNYFTVIPPEKIAEILATYVDSHLEKN